MTTPDAAAPARDPLAVWCGWVLIGAAGLVAPLGWLAPMGFAALLALVGALCLPAIGVADEDRPALAILFSALIWAAVSTTWSPFHPSHAGNSTILKLALQLPLYWSAVRAARRADPRLKARALRVFAVSMALFGAILLIEALLAGDILRRLHDLYEPIRPDLARKNLGQSTFALALLAPLAALGAPPRFRLALSLALAVATALAAHAFDADDPLVALVLAPSVGFAVYRWPGRAPKVLAGLAGAMFLATPMVVWSVRRLSDYAAIEHAIPLSWAMRMGYWSHAVDWIGERPLRGWGLDASRMFAPGIQLHPHDGALQIWLELGALGAVAAAAFWIVILARLSRPRPDVVAAATGASVSVYLLFGAINFGVWQEWWLGLGALVAVIAALTAPTSAAAQASTSTPILE